uniref:alkaline phosphatase n=1 Tax=Alistipes sp. TaxID=1872444 RepID=UPI004056E1D1
MKKQTKLIIGLAIAVISLCFSILRITDVIPSSPKKPKYVFYFIGDGMSVAQVLGTEFYNAAKSGTDKIERLNFSQFPTRTFVTNYSASNLVTDSAAAGTALATGHKTNNDYVGVDKDGNALRSIIDVATEGGYKVGLVTNVGINHATPSCFYGHTTDRFAFSQLIDDYIASEVDFIAGATVMDKLTRKLPKSYKPVTTVELVERIRNAGIEITTDITRAATTKDKRVALIANDRENKHVPNVIDRKGDEQHTLTAFTRAAIEYLTSNSDNGFFLMVEGGKIDYAAHNKDAVTVFKEINEFSESIELALDFAERHPDETLIVVTSDHDTGGLSIGYNHYTVRMNALTVQNLSVAMLSNVLRDMRAKGYRNWADYKQMLSERVGLWSNIPVSKEDEQLLLNDFNDIFMKHGKQIEGLYTKNEIIAIDAMNILYKYALIDWASFEHTGLYTPLYAKGFGESKFAACYDQTEIPKTIARLMGGEL